jgi:hypothetical protein
MPNVVILHGILQHLIELGLGQDQVYALKILAYRFYIIGPLMIIISIESMLICTETLYKLSFIVLGGLIV